jgi:hypothetical protein
LEVVDRSEVHNELAHASQIAVIRNDADPHVLITGGRTEDIRTAPALSQGNGFSPLIVAADQSAVLISVTFRHFRSDAEGDFLRRAVRHCRTAGQRSARNDDRSEQILRFQGWLPMNGEGHFV